VGSDQHLKLILQIAAGVVLGGIVLVVLSLVLTLAVRR
jgi:hypothetical protein